MLLPDRFGGLETLVSEGGWHANVDDRDGRLVRAHFEQQIFGSTGLADDVEACLGEDARESLAQQHRVVGENDARPLDVRRFAHDRILTGSAAAGASSPARAMLGSP